MVALPLGLWWTLSVHEGHCAWGEAFWTGDVPAGTGPVRGLLLGSSRMGADVDLVQLAEGTGHAWQRVARHTLSGNALPPSYPALLASAAAGPGMDVLVVEVSPLLFDQTSCARPAMPAMAMAPRWFGPAGTMGLEGRPSALAMSLLPHRWLAGSGRRHDIVEHMKHPGHLLGALGDLRHGGRQVLARWPGEAAPVLTAENARNRREFLLGGKLDTWIPSVNEMCVATLERVVRAAQAQRAFLVILPMRPSLRETIEPEYEAAARLALREAASRLPRAALLDFSTRYDRDEANFNDFDHLTPTGAAAFTTELVELLR